MSQQKRDAVMDYNQLTHDQQQFVKDVYQTAGLDISFTQEPVDTMDLSMALDDLDQYAQLER